MPIVKDPNTGKLISWDGEDGVIVNNGISKNHTFGNALDRQFMERNFWNFQRTIAKDQTLNYEIKNPHVVKTQRVFWNKPRI